jgi:signal transduction histidine kinase
MAGWAAVFAAAILLGRLATPTLAGINAGARPVARLPPPPADLPTLLWQLGVGSTVWYVAIVACPILLLIARRVRAERWNRTGMTALVAGGTIALMALTSVIDYTTTYAAAVRPPIASWIPISLRQHVLPIVALMGVVVAIEARRRAVRATIERERLRAEVAEQRLIALAGQLRPHFLFNALQAVSTLIHRDPAAADETLTKLSDLLHDVLRHRDSPYVRLADEARYAQTWLELAKVRFAERLSFDLDVPADLRDVSVPLFILQPLVENALSHGIGGVISGGHVSIRARREADRLVLEVIDNGAGVEARGPIREGIGLTNTRERLKAAFGDEQRLVIGPAPGRGTVVRLEMPALPNPPAVLAS